MYEYCFGQPWEVWNSVVVLVTRVMTTAGDESYFDCRRKAGGLNFKINKLLFTITLYTTLYISPIRVIRTLY